MSVSGTKQTWALLSTMSAFGTKRTLRDRVPMSAFGGEADIMGDVYQCPLLMLVLNRDEPQ